MTFWLFLSDFVAFLQFETGFRCIKMGCWHQFVILTLVTSHDLERIYCLVAFLQFETGFEYGKGSVAAILTLIIISHNLVGISCSIACLGLRPDLGLSKRLLAPLKGLLHWCLLLHFWPVNRSRRALLIQNPMSTYRHATGKLIPFHSHMIRICIPPNLVAFLPNRASIPGPTRLRGILIA